MKQLSIYTICDKFMINLCLIYDFFMVNLYVTSNKLQVTSKIWAHIFVMQGEPFGRTACPMSRE